jgi:YXWGXW repeat-containing protein
MKVKIVDDAETKTGAAKDGTKTRFKCPAVVLVLIFVALAAVGCEGYYSAYPGYYGPYYGGPYYGGYRPYYAGYPGSVTLSVYDRPYYTHGAGYWAGHSYYVWKPGHWSYRHGQKAWIHGHYVVRRY